MKGNIPYFDCYHVTREGNVYSKYRDRVIWRKMAKRKKNNGYLIVSLRNNKGIKYTFNIHRLVALTYIPNPDNLPIVMHLDNDIHNNQVINLKWGTGSDNIKQAFRDGRIKTTYKPGKGPGLKGENHPMSKLTYNQRKEIESLYRTGKYTMRKLSIKYNVSRVTIGNCVKLFKQR